MSRFGLFSSSFKHSSLEFLLNPLFLRWLSVCLHLLLFFGVFGSWVRRKIRNGALEHPSKKARILYYRTVRLCCVVLALYNLCLCCFDYFFWYRNGRSDEKFVTLLDLLIRSSVFLSLFIYLLTQLPNSGLLRFPILLRIWWGFYFSFSCYSLILDLVDYSHNQALPAQLLVSDFVYVISGFILCYAGLFGEVVDENISLEEPLLNGNASDSVDSSNNSKGDESATPYGSAGFLSILTFSWMGPLISTGYKKVLDLEDVPQLVGRDSVNESFLIFKSSFDSVSGGSVDKLTTLQLVKSLIYTTWGDIVATAIFALLYTFASYVGPALIDSLVQYLNGRRQYKNEGYVLVSAFVVAKLVECLAQRHWFFRLQRAGIRARSVLVAMIYKKGLTLSSHSKQGHTSGEIINIMAVDAERISMFSWYMHDLWLVLIQVMLALLVLYNNLGLASIAALVATVLVMLINYPLSSFLEKFQDKLMKSKDKRMKATSEILKNMRILKLQGWEMKFLSKISQLRQSEAGWLKKYLYTNAMTSFIFWGSPTFVSVVTFVACMFMGIPLEAGKILSALATFRILQEPIYNLPDTVSMIIQTKVSLDRIASFLRLEDLKPDVVERLPRASSLAGVEIIGGNFSWDSSTDPTLKDINVRVCHGMKVAVCGTVGSGKSSLLSCILGEMPKVSGILRVSGLKAYVSQSAWIQSGKIVDNILFGKEMDRERYESVLEACSLNKDLEILSFGDQTVIGERGINLSGGQKQRIQIARALYQDADIYLFDDPFSAVDAHTGTHLFKECLLGHLNSKTVIYVTHQVEFLPAADLILVMKDGRISQAGKYDDILATGSDFMELVGAHEKALSALDSDETEKSSLPMVVKENADDVQALQDPSNDDSSTARPDAIAEPKAQIVQEEEREKGKVGFPVYWKYITTAHGGALVPFILLAHISFQILQVGSNYWMAWATPMTADAKPSVPVTTLIVVYVIFSVGSALCILFRATFLATAAYKTATILFDKMHLCIFRAPMSFFDSTPSGRILNRASTDQSTVDMNIAYQVGGVAFSIIQLLAIVAIMSQVAWQVFVIFIPIACICLYYQKYYLPAARELSRLVGVCKAPVIQHFSETISGATTIRGFEQQSRFEDKIRELINAFSRPKFHIAGAREWLCFRLDLLSSFVFACSLIFLISIPVGIIDPVPEPEELEVCSRSEALSKIVFEVPASERKFINVNLLSTTLPSQEEMSNVPSSHAKGSPGGRSSARLRVASGKGLIEQRKAAAKAASSKPAMIDLTTAPKAGLKRKASARPDNVEGGDVPKKRSVTVEGVVKSGVAGTSIVELFRVQDPTLKSELEGVSPSDCIGEAGGAVWRALQCLLGAYSGVQAMVAKAEDRAARTESDLASLRTKLEGAESRCREIERRLNREQKSHQEELSACQRELEECRAGVDEEVKRARIADGQIAGDVGAFYAVKSRIEMIEEFGEGKHEQWDLEAEKETLKSMYPEGDPGQELFRLAGIGEEAAEEGAEEDGDRPDDAKPTAETALSEPAPAAGDVVASDV